jgi:hypothetical protein
MIRYEKLKKDPQLFKCFTGVTEKGFAQLLPAFRQAYEEALDRRDEARKQPRQRKRGGGQKGAMPSIEDKLVFILCYCRLYPIQVLQGFLFGMGQPQANEWVHFLTPILNQALGYEKQLPARQTTDMEQVLAACPGLEFMIDGAERPIRRPKDPERQRRNYSGKKKRHTVKNNVVTDKRTGKIKALSPTVEGKRHDKKLADEQDIPFPPGSTLWQDTGFQGYAPPGVQIRQPKKKPKGQELTAQDKEANTRIARQRISVEHSIGGVKTFRITHHIFRNLRQGYDDLVMETACALHNLRLDYPLTSAATI